MGIQADRVEEVFNAAVARGSAAERAGYLDGACGADRALRERVEALLASHDAADSFLLRPANPDDTRTVDDAPGRVAEGPGARIGRYKLLQLIGEGGFGSVFMAEQEQPVRRRVALKIIKLGMDTRQVVARFEAERQALAMMDHPNIARVLDAGSTETGRPFFVMELVNGVPITEYCDTNNLSTRARLELFVSVCQAVQHAHHKGIIHRDIKPSNVLVTLHDGTPVPKVIDFGIAKATQSRLTEKTLFTEFRHMIGTPEYMSPEQAEMSGLDVDTRSDVYSLGVLLYELLTGTTPFDPTELRSKAYGEIQRMIREVEPPRPSTRVSSLGPTLAAVAAHRGTEPRKLGQLMRGELDWIVMKAMEKDRTRRYETANGLAQDVRRYLGNEPIVARPATAGYRLRKLAYKHRAGIVAVAAVLASLVLGLVGTTSGLLRARAERDRAVGLRRAAEDARDDTNEAVAFIRDFTFMPHDPASMLNRARETTRRLDDGWLREQPETAAICRTALAVQMISGDAPDEAERQLAAAAAIYRGPDGRYGPDAGTALHYLGNAQFPKKDYAAAERWYRLALDAFERSPGAPDNKEITLANLAVVLKLQKQPEKAREAEKELVGVRLHVLDRQIEREAADAGLYRARAFAHLQSGNLKAAVADHGRQLALTPSDSELAYRHCTMLLCLGDDDAYRRARQAMFERFAGSPNLEDRERTAKAHLISTDPGDLAQANVLLDAALDTGPRRLLSWFWMTKALAEFRAGRHESAITWCEKARSVESEPAQRSLELIKAMCRYHLAPTGEAGRRELDKALREVAMDEATPLNEHVALNHLLTREAKALAFAPQGQVPATAPAPTPVSMPAASH